MGAPLGNKNAAGPHEKTAMRAAALREETPRQRADRELADDPGYQRMSEAEKNAHAETLARPKPAWMVKHERSMAASQRARERHADREHAKVKEALAMQDMLSRKY